MPPTLEDYKDIIGEARLNRIRHLAQLLKGARMLHVNSTRVGGGVAEILKRLVPFLNQLGIKADWEVIKGDEEFFECTKKLHNTLQGSRQHISDELIEHYYEVNKKNSQNIDFERDMVVIHDPQPLPLINYRPAKTKSKWIWRCHIDLSHPMLSTWRIIKPHVERYDGIIISMQYFGQRLSIPQYIIYPSIDPLSDKNRDLTEDEIKNLMNKIGVATDKPLIVQVSRFDYFKDPIGVIEAFKLVRKEIDCRLVLAGNFAADDPEGQQVLAQIREKAGNDPDIQIVLMPENPDLETNALQRSATIIVQKSIQEGFGLTVTEAMWKGKAVVGGAVGGIRVQIDDGVSGFLVNTPEGCAYRIIQLLKHPNMRRRIGERAKEYVRTNFLITRNLLDYLMLLWLQKQKGV